MSDWLSFFLWLLEQEPANRVYFWIIVVLMVFLVVIWIFAKRKKAHVMNESFATIVTLAIAFISFFPIQKLIESYNNVIQKTYEEAEIYYEDGDNYEKAKELYKLISVSGYKDCKQKIMLCDFEDAKAYADKNEYVFVFYRLFPYLSTNFQSDDTDIVFEMQNFLASIINDVSRENRTNEMLVNEDWMLGEWSDADGNYIRFYVAPYDRNVIRVASNIFSHSRDKKYYYSFSDGIYSLTEENSDEVIPELVFSAETEDTSYVYNLSSGKMYHFSRSVNLE